MDLPLQHGLEIGLHLSSRHLDHDAQRQLPAGLDRVAVRALQLDASVLDLVELAHVQPLEGRGPLPAEFAVHVLLADPLALEGGTDGHRDRNLRHLDLQAANLDGLLHDPGVRNPGYDVLVRANPGGQNLRDVAVGDDREAVVDGPGRRGVPLVRHLAQRHDEGKDAVLVIKQIAPEIARLDAAEAQGRPAGKTERVDRGGNLVAEGHQTCLPAQLYAALHELFGEAGPVVVRAHEDVEAALLQLAGDGHGGLDVRRGANHGRKTGGRAIDKLYPALAQNHIVGRSQPDILYGVRSNQVLARLDDLLGEQGRHAGIEGWTQVWRPEIFIDQRRQQSPDLFHDRFEIGQRLHRPAGHGINDGQIVARVGEFDCRVPALGLNRPGQKIFRLLGDLICPAYRRGCNQLRHSPNLSSVAWASRP